MMWLLSLIVWALTALTGPEAASPLPVPPVAGVADYQLGGAYPPAADVQIVTRDRTEKPAGGRYSICYVNSFQTQPDELSWWKKTHPELLLRNARGQLVHDPDWPDEVLLDIRTPANQLAIAQINRSWFAECQASGFAAIEPDNLDAWTRSEGLITQSDTVAFATRLVTQAHDVGMAIAQKNASELTTAEIGFDFAVAEECEAYHECDAYTAVYGQHVIEIEYSDNHRDVYDRACHLRAGTVSIMLRDREVLPRGETGYVHQTC